MFDKELIKEFCDRYYNREDIGDFITDIFYQNNKIIGPKGNTYYYIIEYYNCPDDISYKNIILISDDEFNDFILSLRTNKINKIKCLMKNN